MGMKKFQFRYEQVNDSISLAMEIMICAVMFHVCLDCQFPSKIKVALGPGHVGKNPVLGTHLAIRQSRTKLLLPYC